MPAESNRSPVYRDMLDILFANRNQAYGAYLLRRNYPNHLRKALVYALMLVAALFAVPLILNAVNRLRPIEKPGEITYEIGPPPVLETPPPQPPVVEAPAPPTRSTDRLVPPAVAPDDAVEELPRLAIDELAANSNDIGTDNLKGPDDAPPALTDNPVELRIIEEPTLPAPESTYELIDIQKPPAFPGGELELLRYLAKNIQYPAMAVQTRIEGTVHLSFVINKDGSVSEVTILRDIGGGCGKEAVRVVGNMPRWSPGEANGHAVKVRYRIPVRFEMK